MMGETPSRLTVQRSPLVLLPPTYRARSKCPNHSARRSGVHVPTNPPPCCQCHPAVVLSTLITLQPPPTSDWAPTVGACAWLT